MVHCFTASLSLLSFQLWLRQIVKDHTTLTLTKVGLMSKHFATLIYLFHLPYLFVVRTAKSTFHFSVVSIKSFVPCLLSMHFSEHNKRLVVMHLLVIPVADWDEKSSKARADQWLEIWVNYADQMQSASFLVKAIAALFRNNLIPSTKAQKISAWYICGGLRRSTDGLHQHHSSRICCVWCQDRVMSVAIKKNWLLLCIGFLCNWDCLVFRDFNDPCLNENPWARTVNLYRCFHIQASHWKVKKSRTNYFNFKVVQEKIVGYLNIRFFPSHVSFNCRKLRNFHKQCDWVIKARHHLGSIWCMPSKASH